MDETSIGVKNEGLQFGPICGAICVINMLIEQDITCLALPDRFLPDNLNARVDGS
jgi:hypothetical protein